MLIVVCNWSNNITQPMMGIEDIQWEYNTTHDMNKDAMGIQHNP